MDFELGYTPHNLKMLMSEHGLTLKTVGEVLDVSPRQVQNWRLEVGEDGHKDMPLHRWRRLQLFFWRIYDGSKA